MSAKYLLMSPQGYHEFPVTRHGGHGGEYEESGVGASRRIAEELIEDYENFRDRKNEFLDSIPFMKKIRDFVEDNIADPFFNSGKKILNSITDGLSGSTPSDGTSAQPVVYSNWSPAASYFGMDQSTAYAEHMANTAHQREVADLKAAGLNPVLGVSGSGATSVSGSMSGASSGEKLFDGSAIADIIGATASVVLIAKTKNPYKAAMIGSAISRAVSSFGKLY